MSDKGGPRFIFITGGVVSSLGKGLATASMAALLEARGLKVKMTKLDPYINVDPGTMSPYQHGEVFVTADGAETDLDLGHYERFTNFVADKDNNHTTGQVYERVIRRERKGDYLGSTVQVIPHVTDEIKSMIGEGARDSDVSLVEIGGTVGDIESLPFLEAIRQIGMESAPGRVLYVHLTLVPYIHAARELKTKPTQHSVKELLSIGIQPDILMCRSHEPLPDEDRKKIALFCNVRESDVVSACDVKDIYEIPLSLHEQGADALVTKKLRLKTKDADMKKWIALSRRKKALKDAVVIGLVGKYADMIDAYMSVNEALKHAGMHCGAHVDIRYIHSEKIAPGKSGDLEDLDGILVPGGFGERGINGKIAVSRYARESKTPYFGICLGMQAAVIDIARHVIGHADAHSTEFDPGAKHPVIAMMSEWVDMNGEVERRDGLSDMGGTMRLGAQVCELAKDGKARAAYDAPQCVERHRHRYEFNGKYREAMEAAGVRLAGMSQDGRLVEIIEIKDHPWFIGCQFHPEFMSGPHKGHPLFIGFIRAALEKAGKGK